MSILQSIQDKYIELFTASKEDATLLYEYTHILPWSAVAVYAFIVFVLPGILAPLSKSKGYEKFVQTVVRPLMIAWNLFLSVFSLIMFLGTLGPYLTVHLPYYNNSLSDLICDAERRVIVGTPSTMITFGWWFALSKYLELMDTVFLVVKKPTRPVPFLHWFHHKTVLLFSWYAAYYNYSAAPTFVIMNSFIHTVMYYYYAVTEMGYKQSWSIVLTVGQILQMVFGIVFNLIFFVRHVNTPEGCGCNEPEIIFAASVLMYGSYLFLFCRFFVRRYMSSGKKDDKESKKNK